MPGSFTRGKASWVVTRRPEPRPPVRHNRRTVIELARGEGLQSSERGSRPSEAKAARDARLSSPRPARSAGRLHRSTTGDRQTAIGRLF